MEPDIKEYFRILYKRLWFIAAVVIVACAAAGIYDSLYAKPVYEAGTKIIVNTSNRVQGIARPDLNEISSNILLIETYKEIIATSAVMDKVVSEYPELKLSAKELVSQIRIGSSSKSQVMTITIQSGSHSQAVAIVNAVSEVFKREIPLIMNVDNVTILSKASDQDNAAPISHGLVFKLIIAFLVGFMIAVGLIFIWEYLDDTLKTEKDVLVYLGKPTLSTINRIRKSDLKTNENQANNKLVGDQAHVSVNP